MTHIAGEDRSQLLLLPEAVEDYVGPDNPVRFIDAFVDDLDLEGAGFRRVRPKATGRPGCDVFEHRFFGLLRTIEALITQMIAEKPGRRVH